MLVLANLIFVFNNFATSLLQSSYCLKVTLIIKKGKRRKSLINQTCDVKKMGEMRGEVGKKSPKQEMGNHFRNVNCLLFELISINSLPLSFFFKTVY